MKLAVFGVSALTLMSLGVASAAVTTYDFENATPAFAPQGGGPIPTGTDVPFSTALTALGVTSSSLGATTASHPGGVVTNAGAPSGWGNQSFDTGWLGAWTLIFGNNGLTNGVTSFQFQFWETESTVGGSDGFKVEVFDPSNGSLSTQFFGQGSGTTVNLTGFGTIGKVIITDLGDGSHATGDGVRLDNLQSDTVVIPSGVPEPSTYLMVGSALAGLAMFRRRRP